MKTGLITIIASVLFSSFASYGIVKSANPEGTDSSTPSTEIRHNTVRLEASDYPDFTYAAETAVDAVVFVKVKIKSQQQYQMDDPFFRFFFGDEFRPQQRERQGSGSGVIIREDGYIVTNNHVVQDASTVEVTLNNNKTYSAKVIGSDPATDVALIKVDAKNLPTLNFADSDNLRLGEWVLAIGSPLGEQLRSTITAGIVSAKGRSMPNYDGQFKIESFIQTDAAVNPGNSGGALVNKAGELVGINTAIVSATGSYSGYSFAVPSNIVRKIVTDLIDFGSVKRVMLGITGGSVTEKIAEELKLSSPSGVYVSEVMKGGSAEKAGLREKDVIVAIDSVTISQMSELQAKVNSFHPGDKAVVTYFRDGKKNTCEVEFLSSDARNGEIEEDGTVSFYGATLKAVPGGVEIVSAGNGKIARAGGEDGFVIQHVNRRKVTTPQDVIEIAKKAEKSISVEGRTSSGRPFYFGFGKED